MNQSAVPDVSPSTLEVVPLGGLGEFGMNMMALTWEDSTILIDAGVMFPDPDQLGVDLIIPDLTYVEARRQNVKALVNGHDSLASRLNGISEQIGGTATAISGLAKQLEKALSTAPVPAEIDIADLAKKTAKAFFDLITDKEA